MRSSPCGCVVLRSAFSITDPHICTSATYYQWPRTKPTNLSCSSKTRNSPLLTNTPTKLPRWHHTSLRIYCMTVSLRTLDICFFGTANLGTLNVNISTVNFSTLNVNFGTNVFGTVLHCFLLRKHSLFRHYTKHIGWPNHLTAGCLSAPTTSCVTLVSFVVLVAVKLPVMSST